MKADNYTEIAERLRTAGNKFCFTGEPLFGVSRFNCKLKVKELGFKTSDAKCNVLVVCRGATHWAAGGGIGKKLQNVLDRREAGEDIIILTEIDFLRHFGFRNDRIDSYIPVAGDDELFDETSAEEELPLPEFEEDPDAVEDIPF